VSGGLAAGVWGAARGGGWVRSRLNRPKPPTPTPPPVQAVPS